MDEQMRQVVIDSKEMSVQVDGQEMPALLLGMIQGAVGKLFVVKHYRKGGKRSGKKKRKRMVVTRYPNMSGIVASQKQRERRDLFREAVVYARWIVADEERKRAFRKTLPHKKQKQVYQAAIQLYMSKKGDQQWLRKQLAVKEVVRGEQGEMVKIKGAFEQRRPSQVIWQKEEEMVEVRQDVEVT
jgi:hypothetical protein